jgi:hypothetical protein
MKDFNPTPKPIIEGTINRTYEKQKLNPPIFKVELAESKTGRTLESVLTSLSQPSTNKNEFKTKTKSTFFKSLFGL